MLSHFEFILQPIVPSVTEKSCDVKVFHPYKKILFLLRFHLLQVEDSGPNQLDFSRTDTELYST